MARPYRPDQGLNRTLLEALAREPRQWPGRLARLAGANQRGVLVALQRMEAHGLVLIGEPDGQGRRPVTATPEGLAVLHPPRRRARRRSVTTG